MILRLVAVASLGLGCTTRANPDYCDEVTPCAVGRCVLETHQCDLTVDATPGDAVVPDADTACLDGGGQIAFMTTRGDTDGELATMFADGTSFRLLATPSTGNDSPEWSPSRNQVAYLGIDGGGQVFVIDRDGANEHGVSGGQGQQPAWAPNASSLLFGTVRDGNGEIYLVNADGTGLTNLTESTAEDSSGQWRPDGMKIAFQTNRNAEGNEIYVMDPDGANPTRVTSMSENSGYPRWSPNGTRISFRYGENAQLWVMTSDGDNAEMVAPGPATGGVAWSPDGTRLAFSNGTDVFTVGSAGAALTNLTDGAGLNNGPRWSPDGTQIVFRSTRDGNPEVYRMDADGTNVVNLTNDSEIDQSPSWARCP
jgi:Tol biopolymer transport system component